MATILNIDTATNACSVSLSVNGIPKFFRIDKEGRNHSELLGVFVDEVLYEGERANLKLDAVAISAGPGSYTGLRIGASLAKGLCYGYDIPLISVDTLKVLAHTAIQEIKDQDALYCSMIDARRMEVYSELFLPNLETFREIKAEIIEPDSFSEFLQHKKVYFFGDGADKCKSTLHHQNVSFIEGIVPLSTNMSPLSEELYKKEEFVDTAYYEPLYLKNFVVTKSKKDLLGLGKK